jgi:hypothetical protein
MVFSGLGSSVFAADLSRRVHPGHTLGGAVAAGQCYRVDFTQEGLNRAIQALGVFMITFQADRPYYGKYRGGVGCSAWEGAFNPNGQLGYHSGTSCGAMQDPERQLLMGGNAHLFDFVPVDAGTGSVSIRGVPNIGTLRLVSRETKASTCQLQ